MTKIPAFLFAAAALACTAALDAEELPWTTDLSAAEVRAAKEHKQVLLDFTGSDWCFYCKKLEAQVFPTHEFKDFASKYVLVRLDFPRQTPQAPAEKRRNLALAQQYKIEGFPTVILADATGRELHRATGYDPTSNAKEYLKQFE